jgi:hypothetical protein
MTEQPSSGGIAAPALAVVGGVLAVVGSLLSWAQASVTGASFSAKGIEGWEGKVTILGGAVMLVAGISAFTGASDARRRLRVSALVGGLMASGVGIYTAITARDQIVDSGAEEIAKQAGVTVQQGRAMLETAIDQGFLKLSLQIGLYLVIAGGFIGVLAAVIAMLSKATAAPMPSSAVSGSGLTGWAAPTPPPAPPSGSAGAERSEP